MARVTSELTVCRNCLCIVANNDWTGCRDEAEEATIRASLGEYGYLVPSCDDDCGSFTNGSCDLCGARGIKEHKVSQLS